MNRMNGCVLFTAYAIYANERFFHMARVVSPIQTVSFCHLYHTATDRTVTRSLLTYSAYRNNLLSSYLYAEICTLLISINFANTGRRWHVYQLFGSAETAQRFQAIINLPVKVNYTLTQR